MLQLLMEVFLSQVNSDKKSPEKCAFGKGTREQAKDIYISQEFNKVHPIFFLEKQIICHEYKDQHQRQNNNNKYCDMMTKYKQHLVFVYKYIEMFFDCMVGQIMYRVTRSYVQSKNNFWTTHMRQTSPNHQLHKGSQNSGLQHNGNFSNMIVTT